jgi:hypothetical protein
METVRMNMRNNAVTQYELPVFNSLCVFKGISLACGPDGIFQLNEGDRDRYVENTDERAITAWFELPVSDLGHDVVKKGRRLYVTGEMNGDMGVTIKTSYQGEERENTYGITPRNTELLQHTIQVPVTHLQRGEQWSFSFHNMDGSDFSIDSVNGTFIPVIRRMGL